MFFFFRRFALSVFWDLYNVVCRTIECGKGTKIGSGREGYCANISGVLQSKQGLGGSEEMGEVRAGEELVLKGHFNK